MPFSRCVGGYTCGASTMLVFVDESGDPGMKLGAGSSDGFAVAAVILPDRPAALACNNAINSLRDRPGVSPQGESEFNKCGRAIRDQFLPVVAPFPFRFHAAVPNKGGLSGPGFKHKSTVYKYPIELVSQNGRAILAGASHPYGDPCRLRLPV